MRLNVQERGVSEEIHGVIVNDPYRWLENRHSTATESWLARQQHCTNEYFSNYQDFVQLREMVADDLDVEFRDQPTIIASVAFYRRRIRGQQQASLYVRDRTLGERLLFNPSPLGPYANVCIHRISHDGSLLAFELTMGGTNKKAIHVVDVATARVLDEHLPEGYARGFTFSSKVPGFHYCHESSSDPKDHQILFHSLGSDQDEVWFARPRAKGTRLGLIADDAHLGAICLHHRGDQTSLELWITKNDKPDGWRLVPFDWDRTVSPALWRGTIYAISRDGASFGKFISIDPMTGIVRDVVTEQEATLTHFSIADDHVFLCYQNGLQQRLCFQHLRACSPRTLEISEGQLHLIPIQSGGATSVLYTCESTCEPPTIFEFAISTGRKSVWEERRGLSALPSLSTEQRSLYAVDGTEIPITLVKPHSEQPNIPSPTLMTGYGGFGVAVAPEFSILVATMVRLGATFALPRIRGGSEFGRAWHDAARRRNRQIAIDDFLAAAQWLHEEQIAAPHQLAIFGGSNAGLLVAAAMTQRPQCFAAVLCIAPLLDMVRYEVFEPTGKWTDEYGTVAIAEDFAALHAYSPYHRVDEGTDYPPTLFVTGDRDDRCNPAHVRKMAARLQDRVAQHQRVLVDYSAERGHAAVLPLSVRIDALTRRIAFLCRELQISVPHTRRADEGFRS